jgi:putative membrane protein
MTDDETSTQLSRERTGLSHHRTDLSEERTGMSHERTGLSHERTELSHERSDMSLERTAMAHERTLMAWIRTATSLISFGFTIYKAFDFKDAGRPPGRRELISPREFAIAMIGIALASLVLGIINYRTGRRTLAAQGAHLPRSAALPAAVLVAALGILGLLLALLHQ